MGDLSEHFSTAELVCRCGCGTLPPHGFIAQLEDLRCDYDAPMVVTSCARCAAHNAAVSTTGANGPHIPLNGRYCAVDVAISGAAAFRLVETAMGAVGWRGIGLRQHGPVDKRIVHLDNHWSGVSIPRPRIWTYPA